MPDKNTTPEEQDEARKRRAQAKLKAAIKPTTFGFAITLSSKDIHDLMSGGKR